MKKILIAAAAVVLVGGLVFSGQALAQGAQGVANTRHNLSTSAPPNPDTTPNLYASSNETEICIFCHTPHGGNNSGPLWNKNLPNGSGYLLYTSTTLGSAAANTARPIQNESLLCLACHDGSLGINRIINTSNVTGGDPINGGTNDLQIMGIPGGASPWLGSSQTNPLANNDLSDDHPISFSYASAVADENAAGTNGLRDVATAEGLGVRFFGGVSAMLECSSCHDPHVDYWGAAGPGYEPFLITPNTGSALCLACHVK